MQAPRGRVLQRPTDGQGGGSHRRVAAHDAPRHAPVLIAAGMTRRTAGVGGGCAVGPAMRPGLGRGRGMNRQHRLAEEGEPQEQGQPELHALSVAWTHEGQATASRTPVQPRVCHARNLVARRTPRHQFASPSIGCARVIFLLRWGPWDPVRRETTGLYRAGARKPDETMLSRPDPCCGGISNRTFMVTKCNGRPSDASRHDLDGPPEAAVTLGFVVRARVPRPGAPRPRAARGVARGPRCVGDRFTASPCAAAGRWR